MNIESRDCTTFTVYWPNVLFPTHCVLALTFLAWAITGEFTALLGAFMVINTFAAGAYAHKVVYFRKKKVTV